MNESEKDMEGVTLRAGAGKEEIEYPADLFPLSDGPQPYPFTGVHDVPCVRALILDCGIRFVLISAEIVLYPAELIEETKKILSHETGAQMDHIWIIATHAITTPHIWGEEWLKTPEDHRKSEVMKANLLRAVQGAAKKAFATLQDAAIGYGCGTCGVNISRMIETCDGWWNGSGEEGAADHSVPVLRIDGQDGKMLAVLYNYAAELSVMEGAIIENGGRHITADLSGEASRFIEQEYDDTVEALFLPGISTDQGPAYKAKRIVRGRDGRYTEKNINEKGFLLLELMGERLGEQALVCAEKIQCSDLKKPISLSHRHFWFPGQEQINLQEIRPAKTWEYKKAPDRTAPVEAAVIGDTVLLSGNNICVRTAMKIKENSPFLHTIIVSCVTGQAEILDTDGAKYMAEEDLYDKITLQARNSSFGKGSAEKMYQYVIDYLNEIYTQPQESDLSQKKKNP